MVPTRPLRPVLARPLLGVALGFAVGCSGPRDATPLPEPPLLDPNKIGAEIRPMIVSDSLEVVGSPGAAPPEAQVRATNLDSKDAPVATTAAPDGSFSLRLPAGTGNELRVDAILDTRRAAPIDYIATTTGLARSQRLDCVTISPGLEVAFDAPAVQAITLTNGCADALSVSAPSMRLGLTDFALSTTLPLTVPAGASTELTVRFTKVLPGMPEDVLFVTLGAGAVNLRYPFTLYQP